MNTPQKKPRSRFISLRVKLLFGFTILFAVVFAGAYYWFYNFATNMALDRIRDDMLSTLNGAIAGINGDEFADMAQNAQPEASGMPDSDPRYQRHQDWIARLHLVEPRGNPYTFVHGTKPYEILWIGDIFRVIRPADQTKFRDPYDSSQSLLYNGLSEVTARMTPYTDQWGSWVSAYGPIRDSKGQIVGGVGLDFSADYVLQVQQAIADKMVLAFLVTYSTLFILIFAYSRVLTRPIVVLTRATRRIADGKYDLDLSRMMGGFLRDEIGVLAEMFQIMKEKVREREQTLIRQVEELKIEVDEAKSQKQVKEIVESDFFQQLEAKARRMRERSTTTSGKFAALKRDVNPDAEAAPAQEEKSETPGAETKPEVEEKPTL